MNFALGLLLGGSIGLIGGALMIAASRAEETVKEWLYECTCGCKRTYLASEGVAPSFMRCTDCGGIAVRRTERSGAPR